jgi:hypothetical protein
MLLETVVEEGASAEATGPDGRLLYPERLERDDLVGYEAVSGLAPGPPPPK